MQPSITAKRWRLPFSKGTVKSCKTWRLLTVTGVHRSENPRLSNCSALFCFASFRYPVVSRYGERRKKACLFSGI